MDDVKQQFVKTFEFNRRKQGQDATNYEDTGGRKDAPHPQLQLNNSRIKEQRT